SAFALGEAAVPRGSARGRDRTGTSRPLSQQLGALPAGGGVLPLGARHLGFTARRTAISKPDSAHDSRTDAIAPYPTLALARGAAGCNVRFQGDLHRTTHR